MSGQVRGCTPVPARSSCALLTAISGIPQAQETAGTPINLALFDPIVNWAESLNGLQLGIVNFAKNGFLPVFPIFNFHFND